MRVLQVYSGNLFGGVETLMCSLAKHGPISPSIERHFALCFEGELSRRLAAEGATVYKLEPVRFRKPWSVMRAQRQLRQLLVEHQFDLVICHSVWALSIFGPAVKRAGVPLILWLHDVARGKHWLERLARLVRPDLVIANSAFTASTIPRLYRGSVRHAVLYHPLGPLAIGDTSARARLREELETSPRSIVIATISRLQALKGHEVMLAALGQLRDRPEWTYWCVGGPQRPSEYRYLERLKALARSLGIADRVRFAGQRSDIGNVLSAIDIQCQPNTDSEAFGISFIEALYAGRPVITSRLGGPAEIIDESCGVLVPPGDSDALAAALRRVLDDPAYFERIAANGPARARLLCDPARQIAQLTTLCRETVEQFKRRHALERAS